MRSLSLRGKRNDSASCRCFSPSRREYKPQVPFGKLRAGFRLGRRSDLRCL
jgi:hypothetical protein